jgi:hypothetical protein
VPHAELDLPHLAVGGAEHPPVVLGHEGHVVRVHEVLNEDRPRALEVFERVAGKRLRRAVRVQGAVLERIIDVQKTRVASTTRSIKWRLSSSAWPARVRSSISRRSRDAPFDPKKATAFTTESTENTEKEKGLSFSKKRPLSFSVLSVVQSVSTSP